MSGRPWTTGSGFMGGVSCAVDRSNVVRYHTGGYEGGRSAGVRPWEPGLLWPRSRMIGEGAVAGEALAPQPPAWWGVMPDEGGNQSMPAIRGFALDSVGDPVEGATIQGFVTSTDLHVGRETTSKVDGAYELRTTYPLTNHYIVAYKAGSPDIAGTTVNTLQPAD